MYVCVCVCVCIFHGGGTFPLCLQELIYLSILALRIFSGFSVYHSKGFKFVYKQTQHATPYLYISFSQTHAHVPDEAD